MTRLLVVTLLALPLGQTDVLPQSCEPLPPTTDSVQLPVSTVQISKWQSLRESPGIYRIYSPVLRPDGITLQPPVEIRTEESCFEIPILEDAEWSPAQGTITFWPGTPDRTSCEVQCMWRPLGGRDTP